MFTMRKVAVYIMYVSHFHFDTKVYDTYFTIIVIRNSLLRTTIYQALKTTAKYQSNLCRFYIQTARTLKA